MAVHLVYYHRNQKIRRSIISFNFVPNGPPLWFQPKIGQKPNFYLLKNALNNINVQLIYQQNHLLMSRNVYDFIVIKQWNLSDRNGTRCSSPEIFLAPPKLKMPARSFRDTFSWHQNHGISFTLQDMLSRIDSSLVFRKNFSKKNCNESLRQLLKL